MRSNLTHGRRRSTLGVRLLPLLRLLRPLQRWRRCGGRTLLTRRPVSEWTPGSIGAVASGEEAAGCVDLGCPAATLVRERACATLGARADLEEAARRRRAGRSRPCCCHRGDSALLAPTVPCWLPLLRLHYPHKRGRRCKRARHARVFLFGPVLATLKARNCWSTRPLELSDDRTL